MLRFYMSKVISYFSKIATLPYLCYMSDRKFLTRCLQLANYARGNTTPNPLVGAVVVHNGRIIGEGYHHRVGEPHAEVMAIRSMKDPSLLPESTVYCSLEPCSHFGKTPPCSHLLVEHGVQRVVIGCLDPNPLVAGRGKAYLEQHGVIVDTYGAPEAFEALNKVFFTNFLKKRPYIALKWARSQDGYVDHIRESAQMPAASISGPLAAINTHRLRAEYDGILISAKTLVLDRPRLNLRYFEGIAPRPIIIGSSSLKIGPKELSAFELSPLIVTKVLIPGFDCIQADPRDVANWLPKLMDYGVNSVLVEGGPTLQSSFVRANLVDEYHEYVSSDTIGHGVPAIEINPNSTLILGSGQYNKSIG